MVVSVLDYSIVEVKCPNCGKVNKVKLLHGFVSSYRARGSTGFSHLITKKKSSRVIGYCDCGYKFKKSDFYE